jgi:hypothetical protein
MGSTPRPARAATAESPMAPAPTTTGIAVLEIRRANVELADGERVGQCHGVAGHLTRDGFGRRLRNHKQLSETALRLGMLTDDAHSTGAAVDQAHRHGRHARTGGELVGAARPMSDDLAHEFVAQHDVAIGVVQRAAGRVVDGELGMIHEVHVGRADRGAQRAQQQLARPGFGVRRLADLQPTVT